MLVAVLACAGASGCGDDEADRVAGSSAEPEPAASTAGGVDPGARGDGDADVVVPNAQARASGRRLDALVDAFAPVGARVSFVVAAETLRAAASDSGADDAVELERAGTVRVEAARMLRVLALARPRVAAGIVATARERRVQSRMLAAIDARARAMRGLRRVLDARGADVPVPTEIAALEAAWRDDWDASLRATREATTTMQETRAELGLEPAPEERVR